jgi:hypothetical protein
MGDRVLFLGAGASKHFGYPITSGILAEILEKLENRTLFGGDEVQQRHFRKFVNELLPGIQSWQPRGPDGRRSSLISITEALSLLDYLITQENSLSPVLGHRQLLRCRALLERAIFQVLARDERGSLEGTPDEVKEDQKHAREAHPYLFGQSLEDKACTDLEKLADWVLNAPGCCTVVTTNYDTVLDAEIFAGSGGYWQIWDRVDFGFAPREPSQGTVMNRPAQPKVRLYKLHGSLNWLGCPRCERIYINPYGQITYLAFTDQITEANTCHCGYAPLRQVMVTPSFVRSVRDPNLYQVWQNALEALRSAEEWYIIGYSLPQEDVAIRSLLLRARLGRETCPAIRIFVADEQSRASYELLFPGCVYRVDGFRGFLDSVVARAAGQSSGM